MGDNDNDRDVHSTPIGEDDEVIAQENTGRDNMRGGGEWPDPDTPPSESAPGDLVSTPEPGGGQFAEAYEQTDEERDTPV